MKKVALLLLSMVFALMLLSCQAVQPGGAGEGHVHTYEGQLQYNETAHFYRCTCGKAGTPEVHADINNDGVCDACGFGMELIICEHQWVEYCDKPTTCALCGRWEWGSEPRGHEYDDEVTAPTCTEAGFTTHVCKHCGYTHVDTIVEALGHTPVVDDAVAPTCVNTGLTEGSHCGVCGEILTAQEVVDALGHDWAVATCNDPATCKVCGETTGDAIGHDPILHEGKPATCLDFGWEAYETCSRCDYTTYEEIPALGHKPGDVVVENNVASDCENDGSYENVVYCTVCGEELSRTTVTVDALGHKPGAAKVENNVDPDCENDGSYENVVYCTVCGEELSREVVTVPVLPHTKGEVVVENEKAATCTVAGSYDNVVYCTVCKAELSRETVTVPVVPHTKGEVVVEKEKAATCTVAGSYDNVVYCTVCKAELSRETITVPVVPHTKGEVVVENEKAATCTVEGSYDSVIYCTVCGEELSRKTVTVDALGHTYQEVDNYYYEDKLYHVTQECKYCDANEKTVVEKGSLVEIKKASDVAEVLNAGCNVKLLNDLILEEIIVVEGDVEVTLDLNGKTVTADWASEETVECLLVKNGALVTVTGNGKMVSGNQAATNSVISALGGHVIIESGEFVSVSYGTVIFAKDYEGKNGIIEVLGGRFEAKEKFEGKYYVLDIDERYPESLGEIIVTGGEFVNWNPANHSNDGESNSNKLASDYHAVKLNDVYVVGAHVSGVAVKENNVAPDCEKAGSYDNVVYCTVCEKELSRETVTVDALGHKASEIVVENNVVPDCENAGSYDNVVYCTVCGEKLSRETVTVDALGHTWGEEPIDFINNKNIFSCTAKDCNARAIEEINQTTASVSIVDYATANSWENGVQYESIELDNVVTVTASTRGNNGKYYTSGTNWRLYQSDSGTMTVAVTDQYLILSVKITYTSHNGGYLLNDSTNISSGTIVTVNASSITLAVGSSGNSGQARITAMEVVYSTESIEKCEHSTTTTTNSASCTEGGIITVACADCGIIISQESTGAIPHKPVVDSAVAATCTETGLTEGSHCGVCGEILVAQKEIPVSDHSWNDATCTAPKTCSACGLTEGEKAAHTWVDATCTVPKTCSVCKVTEGEALAHTFVDGACSVCGATEPAVEETITKTAVLTVDSLGIPSQSYTAGTVNVNGLALEFVQIGNYGNGIQVRDKDGNTSILWNTVSAGVGIVKIELVFNAAKQTYDNADSVIFSFGNAMDSLTYSTKLSTVAGTKTYTITPDVETYTFFKMEHDVSYTYYWDSITVYYVVKDAESCEHVWSKATCTAPKTCPACGMVDGEALGHTESVVAAVAPTCTETGLTEGKVCSVCKEVLLAQENVAALGHEYVDGACSRCGEQQPAAGETKTVEMAIIANTGSLVNKVITWTSGDVTFENAQASSTTAIRTSDTDHFRAYAKSNVTISVASGTISKVVVTCTGSSYATALQISLSSVEGATVSVSGNNVIIEFATPVESFTATLTAQVRLNKIAVTYTTK